MKTFFPKPANEQMSQTNSAAPVVELAAVVIRAKRNDALRELRDAQERVRHHTLIVEAIERVPRNIGPGTLLRVREIVGSLPPAFNGVKGQSVAVTRIEFKTDCMTGVMIWFRLPAGRREIGALDLGWFEAVKENQPDSAK